VTEASKYVSAVKTIKKSVFKRFMEGRGRTTQAGAFSAPGPASAGMRAEVNQAVPDGFSPASEGRPERRREKRPASLPFVIILYIIRPE